MNNILSFDVSNNISSVALSRGQEILAFKENLTPFVQAENLIIMLEEIMKEANLEYSNIDYLAVTVGPGSFTGIRIGLAVAKGISYACKNIKPVAITNFETAFYRLKMQVKKFNSAIIILNAYKNQLYLQKISKDGCMSDPMIIDYKSFENYLLSNKSLGTICTGNGLQSVYNYIRHIDHVTLLPRFPKVKALHIARYADEKINSKEDITRAINPFYIRAPDAVISFS